MPTTRLAAILGLILAASHARADQTLTPDWMKIDAAHKSVALSMVAAWNPDNGTLNFNGYDHGDISVVIPPGWSVTVTMLNHDGMLPHSLLVTQRYDKDHLPLELGAPQVAISKAYTDNPIAGTPPNGKDGFDFRAPSGAGAYWFVCGVPGHAAQGMFVDLKIDPAASTPVVILHNPAIKGRP